ncbi:hypothetical protein GALMADRAFT_211761 [Galerina marginata CBS 339.88]|uniref:Uncharacterized protein n=1 Tax=Galerina marginata (strain CBS 339.88) TaxID=685588 RepID=A0A067T752_GALM3|nr:hypothetical protein GALMADRAFT_211761 [Galerina marginata CBS 339.88]
MSLTDLLAFHRMKRLDLKPRKIERQSLSRDQEELEFRDQRPGHSGRRQEAPSGLSEKSVDLKLWSGEKTEEKARRMSDSDRWSSLVGYYGHETLSPWVNVNPGGVSMLYEFLVLSWRAFVECNGWRKNGGVEKSGRVEEIRLEVGALLMDASAEEFRG